MDHTNYVNVSDEILSKARESSRRRILEKASKLDPLEYKGPVCHPERDTFWCDWLEFLQATDEDERPEYLYCCTVEPVCKLDTDEILENAIQDAFEGFELGILHGIDELEVAIKAFNERNAKVVNWHCDTSRVLMVKSIEAQEESLTSPPP